MAETLPGYVIWTPKTLLFLNYFEIAYKIYEPGLMGPPGLNAAKSRGGGIKFGDHQIVIPLVKNYQHYPIEMSSRHSQSR